MSNLAYPISLPGLTYGMTRAPIFNTGVQQALSGKESRIAYQQYPLMTWEFTYELLRNYPGLITAGTSDLQSIVGLYMALQGKYDTCLLSDPTFNTVTAMQFATVSSGDTAGTNGTRYQITATYENTGGPGLPELIQSFNGTPSIYYGTGTSFTFIPSTHYAIDGGGGLVFGSGYLPSVGNNLVWSGSFYYRVRFDDDSLDAMQFMQDLWEIKKVKLRQVKV